ncbi:MAG TPA: alpha/beta hydrolase, partial [Ktedonobacterales bacterium]
MRARIPDQEGSVERDGVKVAYEVFGSGETTILLMPAWSVIHSRLWKMQVPYLARHYRVVTFDGRGNGKSDRPKDPAAYAKEEYVADALAVLDATNTPRAAVVTLSMSAQWGLLLAANHPERVAGVVFIAPALPIAAAHGYRMVYSFDDALDTDEGWAKYNRYYWLRDYQSFLEFFFSQVFTEPHSTKQIEDSVGWGLETTPETLIAIEESPSRKAIYDPSADTDWVQDSAARVRCPTLVIHGDHDAISPHRRGAALAEATGGTLVTLEGSGHCPQGRDPVKVNVLLNDFMRRIQSAAPQKINWTRGHSRKKRALYISSPIGLGHAQRDVAIAAELRKLHPDLEIDWLAQNPVTRVLEAHGEHIHPASAFLSNESSHVESESAEHDLHVFQALRRMDEILIA